MLATYRLTITPQGQEPEVIELKDTPINYNYIYQVNVDAESRNSLNLNITDLEDTESMDQLFALLRKFDLTVKEPIKVKFEHKVNDNFIPVCEGQVQFTQIAMDNVRERDNTLSLTIDFKVGE